MSDTQEQASDEQPERVDSSISSTAINTSCPHCEQPVELLSLLKAHVEETGQDINQVALQLLTAISKQPSIQQAKVERGAEAMETSKSVTGISTRKSRTENRGGTRNTTFWHTLLGALFAFPCAQLILWWVFSVDPFGLAEPISRRVPAVVPPVLRVEQPADGDDNPDSKRSRLKNLSGDLSV